VDSSVDVEAYQANFKEICQEIANVATNPESFDWSAIWCGQHVNYLCKYMMQYLSSIPKKRRIVLYLKLSKHLESLYRLIEGESWLSLIPLTDVLWMKSCSGQQATWRVPHWPGSGGHTISSSPHILNYIVSFLTMMNVTGEYVARLIFGHGEYDLHIRARHIFVLQLLSVFWS
jgi:hypothetical protein